MDVSLNLDLIDFRKPKKPAMFTDSVNGWRQFMAQWSKQATHGDYAVVRQLDLSGCDLNHFPADHIAFIQCNLNGASFRSTQFSYETAFINCSMQRVDFASTNASNVLFSDCDLTGAKFWTRMGWSTYDLDGKHIPSFFFNCRIDAPTEDFLLSDGCITSRSNLTKDEQLEVYGNINDKLERIVIAPILDL